MSVATLGGKPGRPALLCITGASGAGKTTLVEALKNRFDRRLLPTLSLDMLGVPTADEMRAAWETAMGWQKAMTWHWVYTAKHVYRTQPLVILEGSFDPQYAIAACSAHRVRSLVSVLHVDDATRGARLKGRGQPELDTDDMRNWARYLREYTVQLGGVVIDGSAPVDELVEAVCGHALSLIES